jgi:toxin ParE1/3/4
MKKPVIAKQAEYDLGDIADYIARDNPERALSFTQEIRKQFNEVAERPLSFQSHDEWGVGLRSALFGRYHIIFSVIDDTVYVLRVIHGARDIDGLFQQY